MRLRIMSNRDWVLVMNSVSAALENLHHLTIAADLITVSDWLPG